MAPGSHIVFDISDHGFGHAAMSLPVVDALWRKDSSVRLTLRTGFSREWLRARMSAPFDLVLQSDFGMAMIDGLTVDAQRSLAHYVDLHTRWTDEVESAAKRIRRLAPDLLVSNVAYLSVSAAKRAGVRAVAYSSLNWADVFWAYCRDLSGAAEVREHMANAYADADVFLQPAPSMPMPSIRNGRGTAPVSRLGARRRAEIVQRLGLRSDTRLAVLSLGGIAAPIEFSAWPRLGRWTVITGSDQAVTHPDVVSWSSLGMPFIDCLASADVLIIKPGYGLVTEGVCNRKPLLCLPRENWPETDAELAWVDRYGHRTMVDDAALRSGDFIAAADRLADISLRDPPEPRGAADVADILLSLIGRG